jgi:serine phosphatase RsbU (regulator of sigma subunit)
MFIKVIRSEVRQRARFETEISLAREIQESLQPAGRIETSKFSAFGMTVPASEVGGDYFDFIQKEGDILIAAIADVTGHGVGAGILSAMTKSALYMELAHTTDPGEILRRLNNTIHSLSDEKTFVTFALIEFRLSEGKVRAATAGHPPIFMRRAGSTVPEEIRTGGMALGMKADATFRFAEIACAPGDSFCLYTDGILEAADNRKEEFGSGRLARLFGTTADDPEECCRETARQVKSHAANGIVQDDVSILVIHLK